MKTFFFIVTFAIAFLPLRAQDKRGAPAKVPVNNTLPDLNKCIIQAQEHMSLFTENLDSNSKEMDVNSIIIDFQRHIDSMSANRGRADALLAKHYAALRMFFLTTTNKTTVATSFLSVGPPFLFCLYNDTASALYIGAVKDGEIYNLGRMTEKRVVKTALMNCLLPSLKALDEFKNNEVKYIGFSIYYGCKDSREGTPTIMVAPFCLTLVATLADIQQYNAGIITAKGLVAMSSLYLSDTEDYGSLRKIQLNLD